MEEKHLLQQITYLSRLIGEHKNHSQQQSTKVCNYRKESYRVQNSCGNNYNSVNVGASRGVRGVVRYSACKTSAGSYPAVASKYALVNSSRFKKVNSVNTNKKPQIVSEQENKNQVLIPNLARNTPAMIHGTSQKSVDIKLAVPEGLKSNPKACESKKTVPSTDLSCMPRFLNNSCITSTKAVSRPSGAETDMASKTNAENVEKVSRVHVNPRFLKGRNLSVVVEGNIKEEHFRTSSTVHVNPKLLAKIMTSEKSTSEVLNSSTSSKQGTLVMLPSPATDASDKNSTSSGNERRHLFCTKRKLVNNNIKSCKSVSARSVSLKTNSLSSRKLRRLSASSQSGSLVTVSRTKVIRVPSRLRRMSIHSKSTLKSVNHSQVTSTNTVARKNVSRVKHTLLTKTRRSFTPAKPSLSIKMARLVTSKYRLRNLPAQLKSRTVLPTNRLPSIGSKYKIDRRLQKTMKRLKKVKKYSVQYETTKSGKSSPKESVTSRSRKLAIPRVTRFTLINKGRSSIGFCKSRKIVISHQKLSRIGTNRDTRMKKTEHSSALVRIGGVLYRTSRTKLTRSKNSTSAATTSKQRINISTIVKRRRTKSGHVVYVRGNKFIMDPLGKTLRRVPNTGSDSRQSISSVHPKSIKRVDIGGVTYVQKSSNLLMRTNVHNTRQLLSQAKQRSIALLTRKMRKNNQPCMIYHRFGKCSRHDKGMCQLLHDPKNVAVCRKFLQGHCSITGCLLSHTVVPEKMPTCKYFLEGCCVRDNCQYLHVKVNAKALICTKFLQGYCSEGPKCKKRHVYLCPQFDQKGSCRKGKYCPYPHSTGLTKKSCKKLATKGTKLELDRKRYYQKESAESEMLSDQQTLGSGDSKPTTSCTDTMGDKKTTKECGKRSLGDSATPCQSSGDEETSVDEPRPKRPKLGHLPSFIALDSKIALL